MSNLNSSLSNKPSTCVGCCGVDISPASSLGSSDSSGNSTSILGKSISISGKFISGALNSGKSISNPVNSGKSISILGKSISISGGSGIFLTNSSIVFIVGRITFLSTTRPPALTKSSASDVMSLIVSMPS